MSTELVDVVAAVPDAILDIRYATARNFTGKALYPFAAAFLSAASVKKLSFAAAALRARDLRLVIYDAYRPLSVQRALWAAMPNPRWVADPARGSAHNRGCAVDVALADRAGTLVAMPSDFDEFGPTARPGARGVGADARRNAITLAEAMIAAGFRPSKDEWWHFSNPDEGSEPLLDVPFQSLKGSPRR